MTATLAKSRVLGKTEPRLYTPPLRKLTRKTSYGFAVIDFARDVLGEPLDPWQEWLVKHAGELLPDGRPRFRQVLVVVARQSGKTHLLKTLSLFWLFMEKQPLVVGMSTNLSYAMESWLKAVEQAEESPKLSGLVENVRLANGEQQMTTVDRCRYKVAASNRRGGRSLSIDRLILDELREHHDWSAWNAAVPAMNARPNAQAFAITNQGDDRSVVLDSLRESALRFIDSGEGDQRLGIFEWSAPEGCELDDPQAWAAANPNLGRRVHPDDIAGPAARAKAAGGEEEAGFRTEILCQRVRMLNPAVDPRKWEDCLDVGDLAAVRARVALFLDVAPDQRHATLAAAAVLADGRTRVEVVAAWDGQGCTDQLRRDLPAQLARVRPQALGWLPNGPAASLAADLADRGRTGWPPRGVKVEEVRGEVSALCMGFAELVTAGQVLHSGDPLLDAHVGAAERLRRGDAWVFSRKGDGHVDAAYAAAGAVHLARTLPSPVGKPRVIVA
ncbi:terminase [Micromonospora sp. NPDC023737]|uniref:terminase n=1 Tax=unclassified Micromonospora TaxID=2617518 RepID=UPI0033F55462